MGTSNRETELSLFWRVVNDARHIRQNDPSASLQEHIEDLQDILEVTEWPLLQAWTVQAIDYFSGRFGATPFKPALEPRTPMAPVATSLVPMVSV